MKIIPVYSDRTADMLVDKDLVCPIEVLVKANDGTETIVLTSPLKFGKQVSLLGVSQIDEFVSNGLQDLTEKVIGPSISLTTLYFLFRLKDGTKHLVIVNTSDFINVTDSVRPDVVGGKKSKTRFDVNLIMDNVYVKLYDVIYQMDIAVLGVINVETGNCFVGCFCSKILTAISFEQAEFRNGLSMPLVDFSEITIEPLGYNLEADRE